SLPAAPPPPPPPPLPPCTTLFRSLRPVAGFAAVTQPRLAGYTLHPESPRGFDRPRQPSRRDVALGGDVSSGRATSGSGAGRTPRSEEHTSELQSRGHLVCRLVLEK